MRMSYWGRLWAKRALDAESGVLEGLLLEWHGGRLTRVDRSVRPPSDFLPDEILDVGLLTFGLVNAHAHLDYSHLSGAISGDGGFVPWLRRIIALRRNPVAESEAQAAAKAALAEAVENGTVAIWDIDSFGRGKGLLAGSGLDALSFREWIAPSRERWKAIASAIAGEAQAISPHTPYTVVPEALRAIAAEAARRNLPVAIHLAESPEERALLMQGEGALRDLLAEVSGADPSLALGTGPSSIARAESAGLLGPATLAIHCNLPEPDDFGRIARSGAAAVYCPRSHAFLGYPPYPLAEWRKCGARLALGTDSLASNSDLSMRAEVAALLLRHPETDPLEAWGLGTGAGLGEAEPFGCRGLFRIGYRAQFVHWQGDFPSTAPGCIHQLVGS